jgi:hypothetical protein
VDRITEARIAAFDRQFRDQGLSPQTRRNILGVLGAGGLSAGNFWSSCATVPPVAPTSAKASWRSRTYVSIRPLLTLSGSPRDLGVKGVRAGPLAEK